MRNELCCMKTFLEYLVPVGYKAGRVNPNQLREMR
jgi:hypothetical protein